jgi:hypothetical protein
MHQCEDNLQCIRRLHDLLEDSITNRKSYFNLNVKQKYDLLYILKQILRENNA